MVLAKGSVRENVEAIHVKDGKVIGALSIVSRDHQDQKKFFEIGLSEDLAMSDDIYQGIFKRKRSEILEFVKMNPEANIIWSSFLKGPQPLTIVDQSCIIQLTEEKLVDGKMEIVPIVI